MDETVSLDGLAVGQTVDFSLRQNADGQWRIASISAAGSGSEPLVEGRGRVVTLMSEFGMVEIDHERIEAIDMPAMSMVYELADGVSLDGLSVGDEVVFSIEEEAPGQWRLTGYSIRSDAGETP